MNPGLLPDLGNSWGGQCSGIREFLEFLEGNVMGSGTGNSQNFGGGEFSGIREFLGMGIAVRSGNFWNSEEENAVGSGNSQNFGGGEFSVAREFLEFQEEGLQWDQGIPGILGEEDSVGSENS